jgi:hypothetical protein
VAFAQTEVEKNSSFHSPKKSQQFNSPKNSQDEIKVLALVSGRAISDRQVLIDLILENPALYKNLGISFVNQSLMDSGLNRVMTQLMILEELKVIGDVRVSVKELESGLSLLKKQMGAQGWNNFLIEFELTEPIVRERLSEKLQVQRALDERMRLALSVQAPAGVPSSKKVAPSRDEIVKKSLEEWISQLKSRYRVQVFHYKK